MVVVGLMLIAMTAVVESGGVVGDHHRAAFATYSAVSVLPVNGTRVSSRRDPADQNRLLCSADRETRSTTAILGTTPIFLLFPTLNRNLDLDQR